MSVTLRPEASAPLPRQDQRPDVSNGSWDTASLLAQSTNEAGAVASTQGVTTAQAGGDANPIWPPAAWVYGVAAGAAVPGFAKGGVFTLSPTGNPVDFTTKDGTPANTVFVSKPLKAGALGWAKFSHGGVGTYQPATGKLELGYGGTIAISIGGRGGVPAIGFLNIRGGDVDLRNFTGTVSGNFGVAVSLDQAAAKALKGAGGLAAIIPGGQKVGAGLIGGGRLLETTGQAANVMVGVGYRVEARFKQGELEGIYYRGQKIADPEAFLQRIFAAPERKSPPVIPNNGDPGIARLNSVTQQVFGTSPWDLARVSGGKNHGDGAVAVANAWRSTIAEYGLKYSLALTPEERLLTMIGPANNAEAGRAVQALLRVALPEDRTRIVERLTNRYDLNFGIPALGLANDVANGPNLPGSRPGDYDFVRSVFQGEYRWPGDNPSQPPPRGVRL